MKKIGILTYHRAYSYGAKLQAYALATYLTSIGFEAEVIDYGNIGEEKLRKIGTKSLKDLIVTTLCYIASSIAEPQRIRHFDEFLDIIPHSPMHYDKANVAEANDKYDYFVTGSDQVWNPKYNEGDLTYLLDFVKENKKKFSYAASFGVSQLPDDILQVYKPLLTAFNKILIREITGKSLLRTQLELDSQVVLDPTFLLSRSQWEEMADYPLSKPSKYILSFQIIDRDAHYDAMLDYLHRKLGYEVIELKDSFRYKPWRWPIYAKAGPKEFLGLIRNAEVVVTNSFHATVFSILFHKPFFCSRNSFGFNSRMEDLTDSLGLAGRMFDSSTSFHSLFDIDVKYGKVDEILKAKILATKQIIENTFSR